MFFFIFTVLWTRLSFSVCSSSLFRPGTHCCPAKSHYDNKHILWFNSTEESLWGFESKFLRSLHSVSVQNMYIVHGSMLNKHCITLSYLACDILSSFCLLSFERFERIFVSFTIKAGVLSAETQGTQNPSKSLKFGHFWGTEDHNLTKVR